MTLFHQESSLLFYAEPSNDRWIPYDRYPRRLARWILRRTRLSGYQQLTSELRRGLKRAGIRCRFNAFRHADKNPDEPIGVLGSSWLLDDWRLRNPAVFGPCMLDHPKDRLDLFQRFNARYYLVPSEWVRNMFVPYFGNRVLIWPVGIDLERWPDFSRQRKTLDFLVYEKFLFNRPEKLNTILVPILRELEARGSTTAVLHCGSYTHEEYRGLLQRSKWMIFLCEHETQGQAYQQALACNVPVLAWDQGYWLDPKSRIYETKPVRACSVPYFSEECGKKFRDMEEFRLVLSSFIEDSFRPRAYIAKHLELTESASRYHGIVQSAGESGCSTPTN